MAVVAGIDEAGFGPLLGPLVVSGFAFRVPDRRVYTCLWETLSNSCSRTLGRDSRRLAIADSKQLFRARSDLAPLEKAALVTLAAAGKRPMSWRQLLAVLAGDVTSLEQYPWYSAVDLPIPICGTVGDVATRANALRRDCLEQQVEPLGAFCEPLPEGHFNRLVKGTHNKAVVLLGLALRVVDRILRHTREERVRICIDRLGGRVHYREILTTAFPAFDIQVLEEWPQRSAYRLSRDGRVCRIEFTVAGESKHFCTALASIYSKYLRELFMRAFNQYWSGQIAGLRPTAGYYTDARRWLNDAAPALRHLQVDPAMLVRKR